MVCLVYIGVCVCVEVGAMYDLLLEAHRRQINVGASLQSRMEYQACSYLGGYIYYTSRSVVNSTGFAPDV